VPPHGINGKLLHLDGFTVHVYELGKRYKLLCNKLYKLTSLNRSSEDLSWQCSKSGDWLPTSACLGNHLTTLSLFDYIPIRNP